MFLEEGAHGLVELGEAGRVAALGGDVRAVDDDVFHRMSDRKSTKGPRTGMHPRRPSTVPAMATDGDVTPEVTDSSST